MIHVELAKTGNSPEMLSHRCEEHGGASKVFIGIPALYLNPRIFFFLAAEIQVNITTARIK